MSGVIDTSTEFGARAAKHLREEAIVWLTTVTPRGAPLPRPVWFLWDEADSVIVYSIEGARIRNIKANPLVALNFRGDFEGWDIAVIAGRAELDPDIPPPDRNPDYLAKYGERIPKLDMTPETFAQRYNVPLRIRFERVWGL